MNTTKRNRHGCSVKKLPERGTAFRVTSFYNQSTSSFFTFNKTNVVLVHFSTILVAEMHIITHYIILEKWNQQQETVITSSLVTSIEMLVITEGVNVFININVDDVLMLVCQTIYCAS